MRIQTIGQGVSSEPEKSSAVMSHANFVARTLTTF